jgi:hypothetical protein
MMSRSTTNPPSASPIGQKPRCRRSVTTVVVRSLFALSGRIGHSGSGPLILAFLN